MKPPLAEVFLCPVLQCDAAQCPARRRFGTATHVRSTLQSPRTKAKNPRQHTLAGVFLYNSLTITYFHTGCSTIIGAKSFHGPVRDGKGWDRLAMVIRHDLYVASLPIGQRSY